MGMKKPPLSTISFDPKYQRVHATANEKEADSKWCGNNVLGKLPLFISEYLDLYSYERIGVYENILNIY